MTHLFVLFVLVLLQGVLIKGFPGAFSLTEVQLTLNFGFLLLAAYLFGEWTARIRLPKLTGYILAGVLLGPDIMGYFSRESVASLRFIDELALMFIALSAGLELRVEDLRKEWRVLSSLIVAIPFVVFCLIFSLVYFALPQLGLLPSLPLPQRILLAALLGTLAIARSPSSTLAVIKECKARGRFSESVLCVTVAMDILVIMLFSFLVAVAIAIDPKGASPTAALWVTVPAQILLSFVIGYLLAWFMSGYVRYIETDRIFFLLCVAFLVTRLSHGFSAYLASMTELSLHLEPLLICMSAGFFLRNRFRKGWFYEEAIDRSFLPIFVVFFALAGTGLDLKALVSMWRWAILYVVVRVLGVFLACHGVARFLRAPLKTGNLFGISFITQAGVSIGLASMIPKRFPDGGEALFTLLLAAIVINQIIGPVAFKFALEQSGEAKGAGKKPIGGAAPS
jgi:Kef-type K+ transport system membrane component KefB